MFDNTLSNTTYFGLLSDFQNTYTSEKRKPLGSNSATQLIGPQIRHLIVGYVLFVRGSRIFLRFLFYLSKCRECH